MSRSKQKSDFLGMNFTTAERQLRKSIIFSLLQKHNENVCHSCGLVIETIEELSIEHILPWEGRDATLFFDTDNIAFSHVDCNRPQTYDGHYRIEGPEGTSWCSCCKTFKDVALFTRATDRWNNCHAYCKACLKQKREEAKSKL